MEARAVITDGKGNFSVETIQVGDPQAGEVQVEIKASGVCHTDHKFMFRDTVQILGHEGAGVVRKVGAGVRGLEPGDHVLLNWAIPCRECFQLFHRLAAGHSRTYIAQQICRGIKIVARHTVWAGALLDFSDCAQWHHLALLVARL